MQIILVLRRSKQSMNDLGHVETKGLRQPLNCSLTQWEGKENIDWCGRCPSVRIRWSKRGRCWWLSAVHARTVDLSVWLSQIWDQSIKRSWSKARAAGQQNKAGLRFFHAPANWDEPFYPQTLPFGLETSNFPLISPGLLSFGNECFLSFWVCKIRF